MRRRREVGKLVAIGMDIRPEARQRYLLGERHPTDAVVLLQHEHLQPGLGQVASARQAIVACANHDGIVGLCHSETSSIWIGFVRHPVPSFGGGNYPKVVQKASQPFWPLYGRNAGYPAPPVQSRTCSFPASGSSVVLASAVQSRAFKQTLSDVKPP